MRWPVEWAEAIGRGPPLRSGNAKAQASDAADAITEGWNGPQQKAVIVFTYDERNAQCGGMERMERMKPCRTGKR